MTLQIRLDDLRGQEIKALLLAHLDTMAEHSPPESQHALDLEALRAPAITFWTVWDRGMLVGCGALKALDDGHGEIKSMHTASAHRGKGVAERLLRHILDEAGQRAYRRLSLETGSMDAFLPARRLYEKYGFSECAPFADYRLDPYSTFMTLTIETDHI